MFFFRRGKHNAGFVNFLLTKKKMKNLEIHEVVSRARLGRRRHCSWTEQKIVQILRSAFPLTFCPAIFVEYSAQSIYLQLAPPTK